MKKIHILIFALLLASTGTYGQYSETFSYSTSKGILSGPCSGSDGTTCLSNDFAGVNWTIEGNLSGIDAEPFATNGAGKLAGTDVDEEACWVSPVLNITGTASFSLDLTWTSFENYNTSSVGSKDYVQVDYQIDGGSWVPIGNVVGGAAKTISYSTNGPHDGNTSVSKTSISGSTLRIRVCVDNSSDQETVTIDNVTATNADVPGAGPTCDIAITNVVVGGQDCPATNDGSLVITATTTNGPILYQITGPVNQSNATGIFTNLPTGNYTITVDDGSFLAGVCTATTTRTIAAGVDTTPPTASNPAPINITCKADVPAPDVSVVTDETDGCTIPCTQDPWINEFHYDNAGAADVGEFVEIAGPSGINLSGYTIYTYDGSDRMVDQTIPLSGIIDNEQNNFGALSFLIANLQNSTEGIALVRNPSTVVEFLSYEGSFIALDGPAAGLTSVDIGVAETNTQPVGEGLARTGTGNIGSEFTFVDQVANPGSLNTGQTIVPCPENAPIVTFVNDTNNGGLGNQASPYIVTRTYQVADATGNVVLVTQTITAIDNEPPVAACQNVTANLDANGDFALTTNFVFTQVVTSRSDNCQLSGTVGVGGSINYDCDDVGDIPITFGIKDVNGNETPCSIILTIADPLMVCNQPPTAVCQNITVQENGYCQGIALATDFDNGSSDPDLDPITLSVNPELPYAVGTTNVVLTVSDGQASSTCNATITVQDNAAPTAICQNVTVQLDAAGNGSTTAGAVNNGSNDACGIGSLSLSQTNFDCTDVGPNPVVLTVTDNNGNSATCSATVTVEDNVAPNALCQNVTVQLDANGNGATTATAVDNGSNDACGILTTSLSQTSFSCTDVGANGVTLTVTDNNSNTATCTATVTVQDNITPTIDCSNLIPSQTRNARIGFCDYVVQGTELDPAAYADNCQGATIEANYTLADNLDGAVFPVGTTPVTWTVTDAAGLMASCSFNVIVVDAEAPSAVCKNITLQLDAAGNASIAGADIDGGSTDACGIAALSASPTNFNCGNIGANSVTLNVTDNSANQNTCTATVTVQDNVAPTAICQNVTAQLDNNGDASITAGDIDDGSNDACGIASLSADITTFNCAQEGPGNAVTVTLTVTDNNGNASTCTAQVEVDDQIAPIAGCQNITVQLDANGAASILPTDIEQGSTDNCGFTNPLSVSPNTFNCSNVGGNSVTLTVEDGNGNQNTCMAVVNVEDNVAPTAICQNVTAQLDNNGDASITAGDIDDGSNDACGIASLSADITTFNCAQEGPGNAVTVTLTVTDNNGNASTCTAQVEVDDQIAPVAGCQNITVQLDANGAASILPGDIEQGSTDNCGFTNPLSVSPNTFSCSNVGGNSVTLTVEDGNGNQNTCLAVVNVEDNVAPTAICQNITVQLGNGGSVSTTAGAVNNGSNDACGIGSLSLSQTNFDCTEVGPNPVVLTVTDNNGNPATCNATVTVQDNVAPSAVCQNTTVQLDANGNASLVAGDIDGGSTDACGIASLSADITTFNCNQEGPGNPVTVTLTVTDVNGNVATCTAQVEVDDQIAPVAGCQNITVQLDANGAASILPGDIEQGSTDNCGFTNPLSVSPNTFNCSNVGGNSVTLTVGDGNENQNTCMSIVTVEDNIAPTALCQNVTVQLDANGNGATTAAAVDNGSNDACGILTTTLSLTSFSCADVGANAVVLTVTDNNGNTATCPATVMVEDNVPPRAVCKNVTVQLDVNGFGSTTAAAVDSSATFDACGIASLALSQTDFNCSEVGTNIEVLTVTDNNGNSSTCNAIITVEDNAPPTAVCQNFTLNLTSAGSTTLAAASLDGGSSTACGTFSLSVAPNSFTCDELGPQLVTLTVTDDSNNQTDNCTATVTVADPQSFCCDPPAAVCENITVYLDANGEASITAADVDAGSTADCGLQSLTVTPTDFTCDEKGPNTVTLTITDIKGQSDNCLAIVRIEDNAAPTAICSNITVQLNANGDASIEPADVDGGSSDNCTFFLRDLNNNTFNCSNVGQNPVVLTISDFSGNSQFCNAVVTVEDNVTPIALCQNVTVQLDANGNGTLAATAVDAGSNDACGIASLSVAPNTFDCEDIGANVVTLTVTDNNGNPATCTATATVEDNIAPTITECEGTFVVFNGEEEILASTGIDFSATDACGLASTTYAPAIITCDQLGLNVPVTVTVTDNNGKASTCITTVKVDGLPCGFMDFGDDGIGCEDSNVVNYDVPSESFTLESNGCYTTNFTQDDAAYVKAELCGNGEIIAHVTSISPLGQGWAGITMRESEAPGAKKVELLVNLGNLMRRAVRTTTNGYAFPAQFFRPGATWLKLVRTGNQFVGYASTNGLTWQLVMAVNVPMNTCIQAGLMVTNYSGNGTVTANFDNVSITGSGNMNLQIPNTDDNLPEATPLQDFSFFPNPVTSELQVDLSAFAGQEAQLSIYNQVGQIVWQSQVAEATYTPEKLDLNELPTGTYFIEVISGEYRQVKKLLKAGQ